MPDHNLDYAVIRRSVEENVQRQKWRYRLTFYAMHLLFFAASMLAVWRTVALDAQLRAALFDGSPVAPVIVILPTLLWSAVILFHSASLYFESRRGEKALRERLLLREVGEDILRQGLGEDERAEKPKRRSARLADDGELIDFADDELGEPDDDGLRSRRAGAR